MYTLIFIMLLGSDNYDVREMATKVLMDYPDSNKELKYNSNYNPDLEIRARCDYILCTQKSHKYDKFMSKYLVIPQLDIYIMKLISIINSKNIAHKQLILVMIHIDLCIKLVGLLRIYISKIDISRMK